MPFRKAVEEYIKLKYPSEILTKLTLSDIGHDDPKLRIAIKAYKKRFGCSPFGIPSVRDQAAKRVKRVLEYGLDEAGRLDRNATMKYIRRRASALGLD